MTDARRQLGAIGEDAVARWYTTRGYDVVDRSGVGFVSTVAEADGRRFFRVDTTEPGNGNGGHEYGTTLPDSDKAAVVEYLKTF